MHDLSSMSTSGLLTHLLRVAERPTVRPLPRACCSYAEYLQLFPGHCKLLRKAAELQGVGSSSAGKCTGGC